MLGSKNKMTCCNKIKNSKEPPWKMRENYFQECRANKKEYDEWKLVQEIMTGLLYFILLKIPTNPQWTLFMLANTRTKGNSKCKKLCFFFYYCNHEICTYHELPAANYKLCLQKVSEIYFIYLYVCIRILKGCTIH